MSLLAPAALLLGLLAAPIIILYMLRLRRQERMVSSTFLWRDLVVDRAANAPWQKLRRNLFMILQLLILATLVLALARPYIHADGQFVGNVIVILDTSASMTATDMDGGASRFDEAVRQITRAIDDLSEPNQITLIAAGATPKVLASRTNDKSLLRKALSAAEPEFSSADWPSAFALAAGIAQGFSSPEFVIFTDGGLPDTLPPLPGEMTFVPVGRSGENVAISAIGTRPSGDRLELLVSVQNHGESVGEGLLSIYLDGRLFDSREIHINNGDQSQFSWSLPPGTGLIDARYEPTGDTVDYLAVDNQAWSLVKTQEKANVLLISDGNLFLERLFAVLPGYELTRSTGTDYHDLIESARKFDLYIFDGVTVPDILPPGNIMIFNPQTGGELTIGSVPLLVNDSFSDTTIIRIADDPRVRDVDWSNVHIAQAMRVNSPVLKSLVEAKDGSLLLVGESKGRKVAIFPFNLAASDLPLQIAFPILMANIIGWLDPGHISISTKPIHPGETVSIIPDPHAQEIIIHLPNGEIWKQVITGISAPIIFSDTNQPGVYSIFYGNAAESDRADSIFEVNFYSPSESKISPSSSVQIGKDEIAAKRNANRVRTELWPPLLAIGLFLLMLEWWIFYQGSAKRRAMNL